MTNALAQARIDLAAALRWSARLHYQQGVCNHYSVLAPGSDRLFLVNPEGLFWSEVTASNLLLCDLDGKIVEGTGTVELSAFSLHAPIHRRNKTARAVLHTHAPYATALCLLEDGVVEPSFLAGLQFFGKIAYDVMLMSATEFAEAAEPFIAGRGSSSTMPQKRNPISCELILAASKALRQHAGLILDAMVSDFERATGPWHVEWIAVPESFGYAAGALHQAEFMMGGLIVDAGRMAKNLGMTHGLIVAEAVMMGLAPHTGRNEAHDFVYDACRAAIESDRPLYDVLLETQEVAGPLGADKLKALTDPANYLGAAQAMVDRVLKGR